MKTLWWQTVGTGNCHLVLLHGWGLNAEVWRCISEELASQFTVHWWIYRAMAVATAMAR